MDLESESLNFNDELLFLHLIFDIHLSLSHKKVALK